MILDDAINYYDGIAKEYRANADIERNDYMDLRDGAFEVEQLASWLNELKLLRERIEKQPEQRWIPCGKCIHADGKHRWCKILDRTINEDYFCYWAEPYREEGEE